MGKTIKGASPGRLWERAIRAECRQLRDAGLGDIRKNWEAPPVPGKDYLRVETSAPDFGGAALIHSEVRPVLFEAKTIESGNFPRSNISDSQLDDLSFRHEIGGVAFVYLWRRKDKSRWIISCRDPGICGDEVKTVTLEEGPFCTQKEPGEHFIETIERSKIWK